MTTLLITNDFPPRIGGIEAFCLRLTRLIADEVVVLTSRAPGWAAHDAASDLEIHRLAWPLLPTPATARRAVSLLRSRGATRVVFGAAAPLGLLAPRLRAAGAGRILAITHGHEAGWAGVPGAETLLRRIGHDADRVSYISEYTRAAIERVLEPADRAKLVRIAPPIDPAVFFPPEADSGRGPTCLAAGRLTRQKGFRTLLAAWPQVLAGAGALDPRLELAGDGPDAPRLRAIARRLPGVDILGPLSPEQLAVRMRSASVFALPVSTRRFGLHAEGLGLVFCEAAACGLPVIVGRSGGAPETVVHTVTGYVVTPDDPDALSVRLIDLLTRPQEAVKLGRAGRDFVIGRFAPEAAAAALNDALGLPVQGGPRA